MKPFTLLLCLFLLCCEKRVADLELEGARTWLRLKKGAVIPNENSEPLVVVSRWRVKRMIDHHGKWPWFLVYAPTHGGNSGVLFALIHYPVTDNPIPGFFDSALFLNFEGLEEDMQWAVVVLAQNQIERLEDFDSLSKAETFRTWTAVGINS